MPGTEIRVWGYLRARSDMRVLQWRIGLSAYARATRCAVLAERSGARYTAEKKHTHTQSQYNLYQECGFFRLISQENAISAQFVPGVRSLVLDSLRSGMGRPGGVHMSKRSAAGERERCYLPTASLRALQYWRGVWCYACATECLVLAG
eukprot:3704032-Rhodomonas_salina.1